MTGEKPHLQLTDVILIRMLETDCKYPDIPNACDKCEFSPKSGMRKGCCDFGVSDIISMIRTRASHSSAEPVVDPLSKENLTMSAVLGYEAGLKEGAKSEREKVLGKLILFVDRLQDRINHTESDDKKKSLLFTIADLYLMFPELKTIRAHPEEQ